jgi:hypothetical protein
MTNKIFLGMFSLQLVFFACTTNKDLVGTYMSKSILDKGYHLPKIELDSMNRFKYMFSFDGYRRSSEGMFEVEGQKIVLTSDFSDKLCKMKVNEIPGDSLKEFEFVLDSNFSSNYSLCVLKVNVGDNETILPCIGGNDHFTIKDTSFKKVESFQFIFTNHFRSEKYIVSNSNSKKYIIKLYMPNDTDTYEIFLKTEGKIRKRSIKIGNVVFRKINRSKSSIKR